MSNQFEAFLPDQKIHDEIWRLVKEFQIKANKLTEEQLVSAIKQAIACGDFEKHIRTTDMASVVVYIPFLRQQSLMHQIDELKIQVEELNQLALRVVPIDLCITFGGNAEQYIQSAFTALRLRILTLEKERENRIKASEEWVKNPNKKKPETWEEWSQFMDGWNDMALKVIHLENELKAFKSNDPQ